MSPAGSGDAHLRLRIEEVRLVHIDLQRERISGSDLLAGPHARGDLLAAERRHDEDVGAGGLDEVSLAGTTEVIELQEDCRRGLQWNPEDFGMEEIKLDELRVDGPAQSAQRIRTVLQGREGPAADIVVANAAAALWLAGRGPTVGACVPLASEAIQSGAAADLLARLAERTSETPSSSG